MVIGVEGSSKERQGAASRPSTLADGWHRLITFQGNKDVATDEMVLNFSDLQRAGVGVHCLHHQDRYHFTLLQVWCLNQSFSWCGEQ